MQIFTFQFIFCRISTELLVVFIIAWDKYKIYIDLIARTSDFAVESS